MLPSGSVEALQPCDGAPFDTVRELHPCTRISQQYQKRLQLYSFMQFLYEKETFSHILSRQPTNVRYRSYGQSDRQMFFSHLINP